MSNEIKMEQNNKLIPELRFPEFVKDGEWYSKELNEILDYERPDNYIVADTNYVNEGTPVLTANKSFVLGHTKEEFGVYNNIPAIIFDDFTVDNKYVNFPFNVKSSAIKILKNKGDDNLKFIYELIGQIKFNAIEHKRYYISEYQNLSVNVPKSNEQQKIADCLSSLDDLIAAHQDKLEALKNHKKGLLQNLFPKEGQKVPNYRFPEFVEDGEWEEKHLKKVFSIFQGFAFSSNDSTENGVRWLKIADVGIQQMKNETISHLPLSFQKQFEKFLVKKGDYVLALTRPILNNKLKIAQVDNTFNNALLNQRVGKIVTTNNTSFVYYYLQTSGMVENIAKNIAGNEPPNLSFQQIENIVVRIPKNILEQKKISDFLIEIDNLITAQTEKIEQLKNHKKGLMQGLFPKVNA